MENQQLLEKLEKRVADLKSAMAKELELKVNELINQIQKPYLVAIGECEQIINMIKDTPTVSTEE